MKPIYLIFKALQLVVDSGWWGIEGTETWCLISMFWSLENIAESALDFKKSDDKYLPVSIHNLSQTPYLYSDRQFIAALLEWQTITEAIRFQQSHRHRKHSLCINLKALTSFFPTWMGGPGSSACTEITFPPNRMNKNVCCCEWNSTSCTAL